MNRERAQEKIDDICRAHWDAVGFGSRQYDALTHKEKQMLRKRMEAALDEVFRYEG